MPEFMAFVTSLALWCISLRWEWRHLQTLS